MALAPTTILADGVARGSLKDAAIAAPFSWTGLYAGVNGGYSWGNADTDAATSTTIQTKVFRTADKTPIADKTETGPSASTSSKADINGWLGGVQLGHNWQTGNWVLGLETDFQWTGEKGSSTSCGAAACIAGASFLTADSKLDWFGTLRLRAGILLTPKVLLYATGGLAYGHVETTYTSGIVGVAGSTASFGDSSTKAGWVAGGGAEAVLHGKWLLRAEYLYMDLGEVAKSSRSTLSSVNLADTPAKDFNTVIDTTTTSSSRTHFTDHIVRIALSYKIH